MRTSAFILYVLLVLSSRAGDWIALKPGMNPETVRKEVGEPLLICNARGYSYWIYDRGRSVIFVGGTLRWADDALKAAPAKEPVAKSEPAPSAKKKS